jgi:hypothetical protein
VRYLKQSGKSGSVLFEIKARNRQLSHKAETDDLPFYLIHHTVMKMTVAPNRRHYPQKNAASHHFTLKAAIKKKYRWKVAYNQSHFPLIPQYVTCYCRIAGIGLQTLRVRYATTNECYNERTLQRKAFINTIRMLQRKQMLQRTRGILSADVARACALRVGVSRFD